LCFCDQRTISTFPRKTLIPQVYPPSAMIAPVLLPCSAPPPPPEVFRTCLCDSVKGFLIFPPRPFKSPPPLTLQRCSVYPRLSEDTAFAPLPVSNGCLVRDDSRGVPQSYSPFLLFDRREGQSFFFPLKSRVLDEVFPVLPPIPGHGEGPPGLFLSLLEAVPLLLPSRLFPLSLHSPPPHS